MDTGKRATAAIVSLSRRRRRCRGGTAGRFRRPGWTGTSSSARRRRCADATLSSSPATRRTQRCKTRAFRRVLPSARARRRWQSRHFASCRLTIPRCKPRTRAADRRLALGPGRQRLAGPPFTPTGGHGPPSETVGPRGLDTPKTSDVSTEKTRNTPRRRPRPAARTAEPPAEQKPSRLARAERGQPALGRWQRPQAAHRQEEGK